MDAPSATHGAMDARTQGLERLLRLLPGFVAALDRVAAASEAAGNAAVAPVEVAPQPVPGSAPPRLSRGVAKTPAYFAVNHERKVVC